VQDDGDALRLVNFLPGAILLVLADGHDQRLGGVVGAGGDLPLHGALEGALEVAQRLRAALADAGVAVLGGDDVLLAARLDARQGQLLAEDLGHLLHGQLDLEDVAARLVAGLPLALAALAAAQGRADGAVAGADAAVVLVAVAELRDVDGRQRDADQVLALLADQLAAADVLAEVALDLAADELAEALVVAFDLLAHGMAPLSGPRSAVGRAPDDRPPGVAPCQFYAAFRPTARRRPLFLGMSACEDAGHERQHVGGAGLVVAVVADQAALDDVDLLLRRLVHDVGHQAGELDGVLLVLEQLQL